MKKIEFIAPVEAMRGNLSGSQDITYGTNEGKAYDQEVGKVTAANNYAPRFIGAKRTRDGKKYFQVRAITSVGLTTKSKQAMALLAGSAACFLSASKNLMILSGLQIAFQIARQTDPSLTWRKWLQGLFYEMLANKLPYVTVTTPNNTYQINNPWVIGGEGAGTDLVISPAILIKFAGELADPSIFRVTIGDTKFVLRNDQVAPAARGSKKWNYMAIPAAFNPQIPTDVHGEHYQLQVDLMDPSKQIMLQFMNGTTVEWYKVITHNGVKVNAVQDDVIDGATYGLVDYQ